MSQTIIATFIRPDVSVLFYDEHLIASGNTYYNDYIKTNMIDTNRMTVISEYSNEGLTLTVHRTFTDDGFSIWWNDPVINEAREDLFAYNASVNIDYNYVLDPINPGID